MKKIFLFVSLLFTGSLSFGAEKTWIDEAKFEYHDFVFQTPFVDTSLALLYDFVGSESLIAGEGTVLYHKGIENVGVTFGGAMDLSNEDEGELRERARQLLRSGTPYLGLRYVYDVTENFHIGAFYGRNFAQGKNIAGFKTAANVRFW